MADTGAFDYAYWNAVADKMQFDKAGKEEFIIGQKGNYLAELNHNHVHVKEEDIVWTNITPQNQGNGKHGGGSINAAGDDCNNMDFETGTIAGWTLLRAGANTTSVSIASANFGASTNGVDYAIVTAGADPNAPFPRVFPGGNFSLRLGNTDNNQASGARGFATRAQQTFSVTAANAKFTYRYAVVLNIPGNDNSHNFDFQKPRFIAEIVDAVGGISSCSMFSVTAGVGATGFSLATNAIQYKPWSTVIADLTPFIGQNITVRFTAYDCAPTGHFGYAYIDAYCDAWEAGAVDTVCVGSPVTMCAPEGLRTYTWATSGGLQLSTNRCYSTTATGSFVCYTTLFASGATTAVCNGPTFTHTIVNRPSPVIDFTPTPAASCIKNFTFTNGMAAVPPFSGLISSFMWRFGDNTTNTISPNPVHTYSAAGTFSVKLKGTTTFGCSDSIVRTIIAHPEPTVSFNPPSYCENSAVPFISTSSVTAPGAITGYTWNLGGGSVPTSTLQNPVSVYATQGIYPITLDVITNQGCTGTLTQTLNILPPPSITFTAQNKCDVNGTAFSADTYTNITWGSITSYTWNFGDGQTSNAAIPTHNYAAPGAYTITFAATSAANCTAVTSNSFFIAPSPSVAFATTSISACEPQYTFAHVYAQALNTGVLPFIGFHYYWDFGNSVPTATNNPNNPYTFPAIGSYTVKMIGVSEFAGGVFCADTAVHQITIHPYPNININVPSECENAVFTVVSNTTAGSGIVATYDWDFGDGSPHSNQPAPSHAYSAFNTYTVDLHTVSDVGCVRNFSNVITAYPNPVAAFSYSTLNNCSLPYTYTNTSSVANSGGSFISGYLWDFSGVGTNTSAVFQPGIVNFPANGDYTVSLIAISNHDCRDTLTVNILVHPNPEIAFEAEPKCFGNDVPISTSISISPIPNPGASMTYTWNFGDNTTTGVASPPPHTYITSGTYLITFTATSNMGCVATASQNVDVFPIPVVDFTTNLNVCLGDINTFTNTASIAFPGAIVSYAWDFGDGNFAAGVGGGAPVSNAYAAVGSYSATYIAYSDEECTTAVTKTITVRPTPTASFTTNGGCLNIVSNFVDNSTITGVGNNIVSWNWDFNDNNTSALQNPNYTYTNSGIFTPSLTVTTNFGCIGVVSNTLQIFPLPSISFDPPDVCTGVVVQFTNTPTVPTGTVNSFVWDFADSTPTVSTPVPSHTYATGAYVVTVTVGTDQNCFNTNTANISVYPYPEATITPVNNSCVNDMVSINTNVSITQGVVASHTLSYGDGGQSISTTTAPYLAAHTYTAYNTYTISLAAEGSLGGCTRTFTNTIQVYPKPFTDFNADNFCLNDVTTFTNISTIPATYSITSHLWEFGDASPNSNLSSVTHLYAGAGMYAVKLTEFSYIDANLTCSTSIVKTVTINPLPVPSFTNNKVCAGTAMSFTDTSIGNNNVVGWSWDFENVGTENSSLQNPTHTYSVAGTHTVEFTARNNFGCSSSTLQQVSVISIPTPSFVTSNVCFNLLTNFTDLSTQDAIVTPTNLSYAWNLSNGATSNAQNPAHTYTTPGNYTVQLTVTNFSNCSNAFTSTLSVYPLPTVSFNAPDVCLGTAIQFTNNSSISSGTIVSKEWNFNDGTPTVLANAPTYTYALDGAYVVTLTATSDHGCVQTATDNLTVHPYASAIVFPVGGTFKCINDQVTFNTNLTVPAGSVASTLFYGDGAFTNSAAQTYTSAHTYTTYGTYTVQLNTVTSLGGCSRTFTTGVTVYPRPFVNFAVSNVCHNDTTLFTNLTTVPGGYSIDSYLWNFGIIGAPNATTTNTKFKYTNSGSYNITLVAFSNGCSSQQQTLINIRPLPVPSFTANTVCEGLPTTFTNTSTGSGSLSPLWDLYNNGQVLGTFNSFPYTYPVANTYSVKLTITTAFNCTANIVKTVTVLAKPIPSFTATEVCFGNPTLFTDQSAVGSGIQLTYTWTMENGVPNSVLNAQNPSYTYPTAGLHLVKLVTKNDNQCRDSVYKNIMVNFRPNVNFTVNTTCLNQSTTFSNQTTIPTGSITSWNWDFDNDSNWDSQLLTPSHTYTAGGIYSCILQATSNKGCVAAKTGTVLVHEKPTADFSFPRRPCLSDVVEYTNLTTSPNGFIRGYEWDYTSDGTVDNTTAEAKHTFSVNGVVATRLAVINNFGCTSVITKTLYINPKAKASFYADKTDGCPALCVMFSNLSSIPSGSITNIEWDFGDGDVPSYGPNPVHCFNSGAYDITIKLTSDSGCVTTHNAENYINVRNLPVAGFNVFPSEVDEDEPNISIVSNASSDATSARYFISDGANFNTFDFNHTIRNLDTRVKPMIVQVVRNQYGCADTTFKLLDLKPSFNVYVPDVFTPNGDGLNDVFQVKGLGISKFNMRIFDRWGHLIFESNDINQSWDGRARNSDSPIKEGVYIWKARIMDIFGKTHDLSGHVTALIDDGDY
ncbi:MAG: PKD domain-containing protein [Bacteroidetes bacterium]|nr:PKD domain-containing protein [Bacteroidota bacterium]